MQNIKIKIYESILIYFYIKTTVRSNTPTLCHNSSFYSKAQHKLNTNKINPAKHVDETIVKGNNFKKGFTGFGLKNETNTEISNKKKYRRITNIPHPPYTADLTWMNKNKHRGVLD